MKNLLPEGDPFWYDPSDLYISKLEKEITGSDDLPFEDDDVTPSEDDLTNIAIEKQLDDYVDKTGWSYDRACRDLGISLEDLNRKQNEKQDKPGPCVSLAERAINLTMALKSYSLASRAKGHEDVLSHSPHAPGQIEESIKTQKGHTKDGDEAFIRAFGAGEAMSNAQLFAPDFKAKYIGPDNKKARDAYLKVLDRQRK